jgi:hypothetical protein
LRSARIEPLVFCGYDPIPCTSESTLSGAPDGWLQRPLLIADGENPGAATLTIVR